MKALIGSLVGLGSLAIVARASAALKLTPQDVVDLALSKGYRAKSAELVAQRSYLGLQRALGAYDLTFKFTPSYETNEAETLSGTGNLLDRTQTYYSSLSKQFSSGTNLSLEYYSIQQNSTLSSTSTRSPNVALNSAQLTLKQALWRNAFGFADRLAEEIGRGTMEAALETREQNLQGVLLDAMTLFWNTFIAERQLKENMAAREKYELLIKSVRQKAGFNLSSPGELPRLQAELEGIEQKVKTSSANYLNSLQSLLTAIKVDAKEPVEIDAPQTLPPVPKLDSKDAGGLRAVKIARTNLENAKKSLDQVKSQNRPRLDLVAKAKSTGVEDGNSGSVAEMQAGSKPTYYVGVEFEAPLGSDLKRGLIADAEVSMRQAELDLLMQTDQARDALAAQERGVASQYAIAKSAIETVEFRARVVRDIDIAYRQGRQSLVEVIRAYNDLFNAQQERANAIGRYHIALNQYAAARDELISKAGATRASKR